MSDIIPPLSTVEQMRVDAANSTADFARIMNLLPGMSQGTMNVLLAAHQNMNTPGARGGNLISLPAPGEQRSGGDDESR